jgi:hypothetical protein
VEAGEAAEDSRLRGGATLYDYWGLGGRPAAVRELAAQESWGGGGGGLALRPADPAESEALGQRSRAVDAELGGVCARRFAQLAEQPWAEVPRPADALIDLQFCLRLYTLCHFCARVQPWAEVPRSGGASALGQMDPGRR